MGGLSLGDGEKAKRVRKGGARKREKADLEKSGRVSDSAEISSTCRRGNWHSSSPQRGLHDRHVRYAGSSRKEKRAGDSGSALYSVSAPRLSIVLVTDRRTQGDVEEYVGGPDGDVEAALRRVQDALAYVTHLKVKKGVRR